MMARKRMIDPNIWQSEDFSRLSHFARLLFIGIFSNADDEGRGRAKPVYLKSVIFPYDDDLNLDRVIDGVKEIAMNMSVTFYKQGQNEYYDLYNWGNWQNINRPQPSKIPACTSECPKIHGSISDQSVINHGTISDQSVLEERKRKERKGKERKIEAENQTRYERFWKAYPKKVKKQNAKKSWNKISPDEKLTDQIIDAVEKYKLTDQWRDKQFIPDPTTFLNQARWEDEIPEPKQSKLDEMSEIYQELQEESQCK